MDGLAPFQALIFSKYPERSFNGVSGFINADWLQCKNQSFIKGQPVCVREHFALDLEYLIGSSLELTLWRSIVRVNFTGPRSAQLFGPMLFGVFSGRVYFLWMRLTFTFVDEVKQIALLMWGCGWASSNQLKAWLEQQSDLPPSEIEFSAWRLSNYSSPCLMTLARGRQLFLGLSWLTWDISPAEFGLTGLHNCVSQFRVVPCNISLYMYNTHTWDTYILYMYVGIYIVNWA